MKGMSAMEALAACQEAYDPANHITSNEEFYAGWSNDDGAKKLAKGTATEWNLVWSDDFSLGKLDPTKWAIDVNALGGGNAELQGYTDRPKNVRVQGGVLILEAHKDGPNLTGTQRLFSSGRIRTKFRGDWRPGTKIEVSAKMSSLGRGLHPAIWMLPSFPEKSGYGEWAASGEIDIMEVIGHEPGTLHGTLHFGGRWPKNKQAGGKVELPGGRDFTEEFHSFGIEWEKEEIRWYLDGKLWQTQRGGWSGGEGHPFPAPFDEHFHLILNLAVGGSWAKNPAPETKFPARLEVNSVRVWQRKHSNIRRAKSGETSEEKRAHFANSKEEFKEFGLRTTSTCNEKKGRGQEEMHIPATADLCDQFGDAITYLSATSGGLPFRHFGKKTVFAGPIETVSARNTSLVGDPLDNSFVKAAVAEVGKGRVLIVDAGGAKQDRAVLGDMIARKAMENGWTGILVNGYIRDSTQIASMAVGCVALGTHPRKTIKRNAGARGVPLQFAGARIEGGQYLICDHDGIVILTVQQWRRCCGNRATGNVN